MKIYNMPCNSGKTEYLYRIASEIEDKEGGQVAIIGTKARQDTKPLQEVNEHRIVGVNIDEILSGKLPPPEQKVKVLIDDMDRVLVKILNHYNLEPVCGIYTDIGEPDTSLVYEL